MSDELVTRLMRHTTRDGSPEGCWLWTGYTNTDGYGRVRVDGKTLAAHRVSYELQKGAIPAGLDLDHLCRVRNCVNPAHLEAVTHRENCIRGDAGAHLSAKTHCPRGHEYAGENLRLKIAANGKPSRNCRSCNRSQQATRRAAGARS